MNHDKLNPTTAIATVKNYLLDLQNRICQMLENENENENINKNINENINETQKENKNKNKNHFLEDQWQHTEGGGGITRILTSNAVIEKAGVNFSHIHGKQLPMAATIRKPELANAAFQAMGLSVVAHPLNPYAPTSHMNVRFILVEKTDGSIDWWFGGGFDLTPYFGFEEDCIHWHRMAKAACDPFGADIYPKLKQACDNYFFLKHRNEPRGIGGLFFDDLNVWGFDISFQFIQSVAEHFIKAYQPILARRKHPIYGQKERDFQLYRRGRYVEFNLLYDRGTLFGLQSGGRTESILMSLPPLVAWQYSSQSEVNNAEQILYNNFLSRKNWVSATRL